MLASNSNNKPNSALFLVQEVAKANFIMGQTDFCDKNKSPKDKCLNSRLKVKVNSAKKRYLVKLTQKTAELRNERILAQRRKALTNFRIDFMPLCCDEDLENYAAALTKDQNQNPDKSS